jgi:hypothetical protein
MTADDADGGSAERDKRSLFDMPVGERSAPGQETDPSFELTCDGIGLAIYSTSS